jgi:hypothetical protein
MSKRELDRLAALAGGKCLPKAGADRSLLSNALISVTDSDARKITRKGLAALDTALMGGM